MFSSADSVLPEGEPVALSPREALPILLDGATIFDVRPEYETNYREFDFPNIYLMPLASYKDRFQEVPQDKPVIVVDAVGLESSKVAQFLSNQGYPRVGYIAGGVIAWEHDGFPLKKDLAYQLIGECACMIKPKSRAIGVNKG